MSVISGRWFVVAAMALMVLLVACGGGELPWSDDFSASTSGWLAESDASAEVTYHDGVMRILIKAPNSLAWASAERDFSDLRLTVEATQAGGPDDNEYGVIVRMQDPDHFYLFSISGDGYYQASKYDDDGRVVLGDDWLPSDAIHLGAATNLLEVVCRGRTMTFSVNGVQLVETQDSSYSRGDIGLYAGSFFESDVEIHFDNLRVDSP
jgi:hypothetical protein